MKRIFVIFCIFVSIILIIEMRYFYDFYKVYSKNNEMFSISNEIVNKYRNELKNVLKDFQFPDSRELSSFVPETNGTSLKILIITTWRSGSSFFGNIISSIPGMFYVYEPLSSFRARRIREPPNSKLAINDIKSFFRCDYNNLPNYIKFIERFPYIMLFNRPSLPYWSEYNNITFHPDFLTKFCNLFPFQTLKVLRLQLNWVNELLSDKNKNVKVIYLVRDPRATMNSRKSQRWCVRECPLISLHCNDLLSEYNAAVFLKSFYPDNFRVVRFEELALNPYEEVKSILDFLGLYMHENVINFLDSHTNESNLNPYSTVRKSDSVPFRWREQLNFSEAKIIEEKCAVPMKLWGYVPVKDEVSMKNFTPITNYTLD